MLQRQEWLPLARKLYWNFSYTTEEQVYPEVIGGHPWLPHEVGRIETKPSRPHTANM
jgi:hypothetical protein